MIVFAYDFGTHYQIIVTDGTNENSFVYEFTKDQDVETSIKEAKLLAEHEVSKKDYIPTPI